jgi:hypothetical protein
VRGWLARKLFAEMQEERGNFVRLCLASTWEHISDIDEFSSTLFRRIYTLSPAVAEMFPFAKDESVKCFVSKPMCCQL